MKCDIVKDLLPLYIENLCSSASREAVEEHLEHCETCREEYERMRREYELPLDSMGEEAFIEEKNLFEKSKQELETSFAGTIPAILLGGFCTLFFVLIPPISSSTGNPANYMKIDGDTGKFERDILDFYPGQIPVNARQTDYFYRRYSSILSGSLPGK